MNENDIGSIIIGCAIKIHTKLGPGLLESSYQECLYYELSKMGLNVRKQVTLPLIYDEIKMDCAYRIDLLVEKSVIIEVKSVDGLSNVHIAQLLTYLKLSDCKLGYLINFNVPLLKSGIKRLVNKL